jgi:transcriptional regulator with XRE-family HTH domain
MSSYIDVGQVIRDLRRQRNMTGTELGRKIGLSQSKISKIENGGSLKSAELNKILKALDAPQAIRAQIFAMLDFEDSLHPERHKVQYQFDAIYDIEIQTTLLREFVTSTIPAMLQTSAYRQAVLNSLELTGLQTRIATTETSKRQELLWDVQRHFHFILPEAVLYSALADNSVQIEQLNKITLFADAPNIQLGIIPYRAGMISIDTNTFVVYDERLAINSFGGGEVLSHDTGEITASLNTFAALDKRADYDTNAQALIRKAIDYFS